LFIFRYNQLLKAIHQTLQDILKALKGLVVMSQELEDMSISLFNNAVPKLWAKVVSYLFLDFYKVFSLYNKMC
jgi:hypothetical protein